MSGIRAKFLCESNNNGPKGASITLQAVYLDGEESKKFFKYPSTGQIQMNSVNPEVSAQFVRGAEYYVEFTKAE